MHDPKSRADELTLGLDSGSILPIPPQIARGPRSRLVDAILLLLFVKPMKSSELSRILGKPSKYISSYLSYWKTRGFVQYVAGYWMLTEIGREYVRALMLSMDIDPKSLSLNEVGRLVHKLINEEVSATKNSKDRQGQANEANKVQLFIVAMTSSQNPLQNHINKLERVIRCMKSALAHSEISEDEMFIVENLVEHYIHWGSTYKYLDQLSEELNYDIRELVQVLRRLQSKKIVYLYNDRKLGIRVGIGKTLKKILDICVNTT